MNLLLNTYSKHAGRKPLFSEIVDIDYYDGPTEALCRLAGTEQWFIGSLVYIDLTTSERILTLVEIDKETWLNFKSIQESGPSGRQNFYGKLKEQVRDMHAVYRGDVFLYKGDGLNTITYELVQISIKDLHYFKDIEKVIEQSEDSKAKWLTFFSPAP